MNRPAPFGTASEPASIRDAPVRHRGAGRKTARRAHVKGQRGFSLLEIMVVVVIIALTVTLVTLNLERPLDKVAVLEARRFASLVEHVRDESILSGQIYAIEVDEAEKSYRFLTAGDAWTPVARDDVLRKRYFPEYLDVRFDLLAAAEDADAEQSKTLLVIENLGEVTPFALVISGDEFRQQVGLDEFQNIVVTQVAREPG